MTEYIILSSLRATFFATKFSLWITQCTTNMLGLSSYRSKQVNQLDTCTKQFDHKQGLWSNQTVWS